MRYKAVKEYNDAPPNPISISRGEELVLVEESDPSGDWPNWVYCKGDNKEGWVPKQIVDAEGEKLISSEDYSAKEHDLKTGDILISTKELNGWIWSHKEQEPDMWAWAPLNHLQAL